jgi:hypothetical protein
LFDITGGNPSLREREERPSIPPFKTDLNNRFDARSIRPLGGRRVVALLILIAALVARSSGQAIGLSFVLFLLTYPVQTVLARAGEDTAFLGGLHTLDAFVILGLAGYLRGSADRPRRAATA